MANATQGWRLSWSRLDAARCRRRLKTRGAVAAETQTYMYSNMLLYSTVDGNLGNLMPSRAGTAHFFSDGIERQECA